MNFLSLSLSAHPLKKRRSQVIGETIPKGSSCSDSDSSDSSAKWLLSTLSHLCQPLRPHRLYSSASSNVERSGFCQNMNKGSFAIIKTHSLSSNHLEMVYGSKYLESGLCTHVTGKVTTWHFSVSCVHLPHSWNTLWWTLSCPHSQEKHG